MYRERLRTNLPRVRDALGAAAERAGRTGDDVTLVAVTKGHPSAAVEAAVEAGIADLGENRVEELEEKVTASGRRVARWHMIGHLQRRKAPRVLEVCDLLHSLDSIRLAERLGRVIEEGREPLPALVQVNTSGEAAKSGFPAAEAVERIHELLELPGLRIEGVMTMAPFVEDEAVLRETFRGLRQIHEAAGRIPGYRGRHLSMGMTNDFAVAVEEGSTMVRIGTALFGERPQ